MDRLLLTPQEAADALAVSRTKVFELIRVGAIESVRIGSCRRIPAVALSNYLDRLRDDTGTAA